MSHRPSTPKRFGVPQPLWVDYPKWFGSTPKWFGGAPPNGLGPTRYLNEVSEQGIRTRAALACSRAATRIKDHSPSRRRVTEPFQLTDLPPEVAARIKEHDGACRWVSDVAIDKDGYPRFRGEGLYRAVYRELVGEIPAGLVIDHVAARGCVRRDCCTPEHLQAVTPRVNTLRGRSFAAVNAAKTRCGTCGEPYDLLNTYFKPHGLGRDCRRCIRARAQRYRTRLRQRQLAAAA